MRGAKPTPQPYSGDPIQLETPDEIKGSSDALREWQRIVKLLSKYRILTESDQSALLIYCTSYAQYRQAETKLQEQGLVITSPGGALIRNPWSVVQSQTWERIRPLMAELGLSPSARARLKITDAPPDSDEI